VLVFRIDEGTRASEETMAALKTAANGWNLGIQLRGRGSRADTLAPEGGEGRVRGRARVST
jgi:hypothetical protein